MQFLLEQILVGKAECILLCIDIGILRQCEFNKSIILAFAKKNADSWFLKILFYEAIIIVDVHLHLTEILMAEIIHL